jgi:hypothetical protein
LHLFWVPPLPLAATERLVEQQASQGQTVCAVVETPGFSAQNNVPSGNPLLARSRHPDV